MLGRAGASEGKTRVRTTLSLDPRPVGLWVGSEFVRPTWSVHETRNKAPRSRPQGHGLALDGTQHSLARSLTPNYYCRPHMSPSKVLPPERAPLVMGATCSHGVVHTPSLVPTTVIRRATCRPT